MVRVSAFEFASHEIKFELRIVRANSHRAHELGRLRSNITLPNFAIIHVNPQF